jgi:hypothetical protein
MVSRKSQLKKLKVDELKEIIRANNLGSVSGKKDELLERIGNHERFNEIKGSITIPQRTRAPPTEKQIAHRKKFQKMVFEKHNKINIKKEGIIIKRMADTPYIKIKEITKKKKK